MVEWIILIDFYNVADREMLLWWKLCFVGILNTALFLFRSKYFESKEIAAWIYNPN